MLPNKEKRRGKELYSKGQFYIPLNENIPTDLKNLSEYFCPLFLTSTDLIKDTKAIIFLSNSQASLTNRVKCGIMFTLHKLHIFSLIRENTLVKSVFSLFSYRIGESLCSNIRGEAFFRCIPSGVHLFICG